MDNYYLTDRFALRVLSPHDCGIVLNFLELNKSYFEPYESKKPDSFYTEAFQYETLMAESNFFIEKSFLRYYIFLNNYPDPVGTVSYKKVSKPKVRTMSLGYKLDHRFWGMGLAFESISFLSGLIFREHIADKLEAVVQPDNFKSIKLLKRLGFSHRFGDIKKYDLASGTVMHDIYYLTP
mgnify:CR=1 FL=1